LIGSGVNREVPAPFYERPVGKFHRSTHHKVHWVLDVGFLEDLSQISTGNAAENFSIFRRMSLNIIRLDPDKKTSLIGKRQSAGWNDEYMAYLLGLAAINKF
jgi:hypothetical protein